MPGAGHPLVEVLFVVTTSEVVTGQHPVTALLRASDIDVLSNFVFGFEPDATQWLSGAQIDVSSVSDCEQSVCPAARRSLQRFRRLN